MWMKNKKNPICVLKLGTLCDFCVADNKTVSGRAAWRNLLFIFLHIEFFELSEK